jgi:hypothetical protein
MKHKPINEVSLCSGTRSAGKLAKIIASDMWTWQQRRPDRKNRACVILVKQNWLQMMRGSGLIFREADNALVGVGKVKGFMCL